MAGLSTRAPSPSLSESYLESIRSFGRFLLALNEEGCRVIHLEQVNLSEALEEYGRTKIWGDQIKAELPARARGSLDDKLRHDDELKCLVQAILLRLRNLLDQATYIAKKKYDAGVGSDHDSISSVSADSDSDSNDNGENRRHRVPKIRLLTQQIWGQIRSLYDLSALLRRPKIADKYIRSVNSKSNTATRSGGDTYPLSVGFSSFDESHIVEKVLQWRGLTKSEQCIKFDEENVAPLGRNVKNDCVDILWFCQRLARANTRRREQLQYWTDFPYDFKQDTADVTIPQVDGKQFEGKQKSEGQASTYKPPDTHVSRETPRSAVSKQSFSTAAVSDIYDTKTNIRPQTVYAPTVIGQGRTNSVPDPPKPDIGEITFPCPYCGMTLEYREMQNRWSWQHHVFRDLRPYVCTFKDCQNAGKLYVSRHDWIYHELQIHRREYVCKECHMTCSNRKEMSIHLREHYGESISPAYLGVILDLCDHQLDFLDDKKDSCLICGKELSLPALQDHLAKHMEDIALFVLPKANEKGETGDSKASVQVAKLKSEGKASGTESKPSSLGFSAAGDFGQTPADFAKLLTSKEEEYTSKPSSWRTSDEDQQWTSTKAIVARLRDLDRDVRCAAVQALAGQTTLPDEILEAMAARLEDADRAVRCAAVQALGDQTTLPDRILEAIAVRLEDIDGAVRSAAFQALGNQTTLPDKILEAIAVRLEAANGAVRSAAFQALGDRTTLPDKVLEALAVKLDNVDGAVRSAAFQALGKQTTLPDKILEAIAVRLEAANGAVRSAAFQALGDRTTLPDKILEALAVRLEDVNGAVRSAAVQALGNQTTLPDKILEAMAARLEDADGAVRCAAVQALVGRPDFPDRMLKISLRYLNILISLLGKQKDYKNLVRLLSRLWANRNQPLTWSPTSTLALAHHYILARYLVGDTLDAQRLAEDIVYNCQRVNGALHNSTLKMSTLLSQLYTGIARRYQSQKGGQHMANQYYKKSASMHEMLLRILAGPSVAVFKDDDSISIDGSTCNLDISDTAIDVGEHVRQHLQLLKLAVQRLGDWPKDYADYERLNADLFLKFHDELKGVDGVDKWDLKAFGSGKAAGDEDMLDLEFKSWGLDIAQEVKEELLLGARD